MAIKSEPLGDDSLSGTTQPSNLSVSRDRSKKRKIEHLEVNISDTTTTDTFHDAPNTAQPLTNEEAAIKLKAMENPKIKLKKDPYGDAPLDPTMILALLDKIPAFEIPIDKAESEVGVSRSFMSTVYGGNSQDTFPRIRKEKLEEHGFDGFMYTTKSWNPNAPSMPGRGGLYYGCTSDLEPEGEEGGKKKKLSDPKWHNAQVQRVFTRIASNDWLYMGQYRITYCKRFTKEEWCRQSLKVRNTWASNIAVKVWATSLRARVALRAELGRTPTVLELGEALERAEKEKDNFKHVTVEQIQKAYENGEESVDIWNMECIDYDAEFQRQLVQKYQNWTPPAKSKGNKNASTAKKGKKKAKKGSTTKDTVAKRGAGRKRKRSDDNDSESEDEPEDEPEDELDDRDSVDVTVPTRTYMNRGTRSRPVIID